MAQLRATESPKPTAWGAQKAADAAALDSATGKAILEVLREPAGFQKSSQLALLLAQLGAEAAPAARAILTGPVPEFDLDGVESILLARTWATHDPAAATPWALTRAPSGVRAPLVSVTVELWATLDPEAAVEGTKQTIASAGTYSQTAQIALVRGWLASGQPGLYAYVRGLGVTFERQRALSWYIRGRIQRDGVDAITDWLTTIPEHDKRFKLDAFRGAATELAKIDQAAAAAFCDAHCEGPYGVNMRRMIAHRWASRDGQGALEWVSGAPAGDERNWAVTSTMSSWWREDRAGLDRWMSALGPENVEPWFQPALSWYAVNIAWQRPNEALRWAAAIEIDEARERAFVMIGQRWHSQDESAADAWIDQSPLSAEARERARNPVQPRRAKVKDDVEAP